MHVSRVEFRLSLIVDRKPVGGDAEPVQPEAKPDIAGKLVYDTRVS
jgi:hypothetical protein